jgi:hypothetical protein
LVGIWKIAINTSFVTNTPTIKQTQSKFDLTILGEKEIDQLAG